MRTRPSASVSVPPPSTISAPTCIGVVADSSARKLVSSAERRRRPLDGSAARVQAVGASASGAEWRPTATTSSMLSARQAVSTSGSGMAARSELMPIPQVSRCESNATLTAAPEVGPKPYSRRTSEPANQLRSWLPGTLVATKSMPFNIDPKIEVVTSLRKVAEDAGQDVGQPDRGLVPPRSGHRSQGPHALGRIVDRRRQREAHRREPIPARGVTLPASADRHRHPKLFQFGAVALVVAAQPAHDGREERVVERPADRSPGGSQILDGDVQRVEVTIEAAAW